MLSASEPAGSSVTFVTSSSLTVGAYYDSENVSNQVTGTVKYPTKQTCTAGPGATGGDKTFLIYPGRFDGVPEGQCGGVASRFGSADQETHQVAFGAY